MRLEGKVAFISGGARGMGAAEARLFASEGAMVAIADVLEEEGRRVAAQIGESGGKAIFLPLDVTSESQWQDAIAATVTEFGKLDILVNNAGIGGHGNVENTTVEDWDRVMDINAKGVFLGTKAAIPELRRAGGGSIINISSQLGLVGVDNSSPQYQASKGAVRLLTKSTAIQYAGEGIRANSVHPGFMPPMTTAMPQRSQRDEHIRLTPLRRTGEVHEVANGVLFLASDEASFITATELVIDGGFISR